MLSEPKLLFDGSWGIANLAWLPLESYIPRGLELTKYLGGIWLCWLKAKP